MMKVAMIVRRDFRDLFGSEQSDKCGFFVDHHLSAAVHSFADWIEYRRGNHLCWAHSDRVTSLAVSSDGCFSFTGSEDKSIVAWDLRTDTKFRQWDAEQGSVECLAHSRGLLVSGGSDKSVRVWDAHTHRLRRVLLGHSSFLVCVDLNRSATLIASGSADCTTRLWCTKDGRCLRVLRGHSECVSCARFKGDLLLTGSFDQSVQLWDPSEDSALPILSQSLSDFACGLSVNCDGSRVACVYGSGLVIWEWPSMEVLRTVEVSSFRAEFHPRHPHVLAVSENGCNRIRLMDIRKEEWLLSLERHSRSITDIRFSPDGYRLLSVSADKSARFWDLSEFEEGH